MLYHVEVPETRICFNNIEDLQHSFAPDLGPVPEDTGAIYRYEADLARRILQNFAIKESGDSKYNSESSDPTAAVVHASSDATVKKRRGRPKLKPDEPMIAAQSSVAVDEKSRSDDSSRHELVNSALWDFLCSSTPESVEAVRARWSAQMGGQVRGRTLLIHDISFKYFFVCVLCSSH